MGTFGKIIFAADMIIQLDKHFYDFLSFHFLFFIWMRYACQPAKGRLEQKRSKATWVGPVVFLKYCFFFVTGFPKIGSPMSGMLLPTNLNMLYLKMQKFVPSPKIGSFMSGIFLSTTQYGGMYLDCAPMLSRRNKPEFGNLNQIKNACLISKVFITPGTFFILLKFCSFLPLISLKSI